MARKDVLDGLNLFFENTVEQLQRAQREARGTDTGVQDLDARIDSLLAIAAGVRNEVREQLMKELAAQPRKLPIV